MKNKMTAVILSLMLLFQFTAQASEFENGEFAWIYEKVPKEADCNSLGYKQENIWKEIFVSDAGSESGNGTRENPFATLAQAQKEVRKINKDMQGDIVVNVEHGFYYVEKMLEFGIEDSGSNGHNVVWLGDKENMPVISGGKKLPEMKPSVEHPGLYEVQVDYSDRILNLYVNGHSRELAASNNEINAQKRPAEMATNEWYAAHPLDRRNGYEYFDPNTENTSDGIYVSKKDICDFQNLEDVIAVYNPSFRTYTIPIKDIFENPDNSDQYVMRYDDMWTCLARDHVNWPSGEKSLRIKNAFEMLDSPGEFYFNRKTKTLYYMPYKDEDMAQAEVIMPYLENLIRIRGVDQQAKVENLVFEGIEFAHTMWNRWSYNGYRSNYGTSSEMYGGDGIVSNAPASAVDVGFAKNITFKNNLFFGIGGNALYVPTECDYIYVIGNAFADIGVVGFLVAGFSRNVVNDDRIYWWGMPDEQQKKKPLELLATPYTTIDLSYDGAVDNSDSYGRRTLFNIRQWAEYDSRALRKTWVDEYKYPDTAWKGAPEAPLHGEKSWLKYDMGGEYAIDKITLAFAEGRVADMEKSNYEILLSNDMYFSEGSYKTVVTQTSPADTLQEYQIGEKEKYRYLMIRTIGATPLAVSQAWAFTNDAQPYPKEGRSQNIYVQNNKFTRMGINIENSPAITMNFVEWKVVSHNEVDKTNYSGIQILGDLGASKRAQHAYTFVAYNKVENTNKMMPDGSGIYTHGYCPYSVMEGNYAGYNGVGVFGYYTDNGASCWLFMNNVAEEMVHSYDLYSTRAKNENLGNFGRLMYANQDNEIVIHLKEAANFDYYWPYIDNDVEDPIVYVRGQPTREVYNINENAGLEPEYQWLKDIIPNDRDHNLDPYLYFVTAGKENQTSIVRRKESIDEEAKNMLKNGVFGYRLGEFDLIYKNKLSAEIDSFNATNGADFEQKYISLRKLMRKVSDSVKRYSLQETLEMCRKLASDTVVDNGSAAAFNTVSNADMDKLKAAINEAEQKMKSDYTLREEFDMLTKLEAAYNDFSAHCRKADIENVSVPGAQSVEIDRDSCTATVYMPANIDLSKAANIALLPSDSAEIGKILSDSLDYSKGVQIPVYCTANKKYKMWTVILKHEKAIDCDLIGGDSFQSASLEEAAIKKSKTGTVLTASPYPYISNEYNIDKCGATVSFSPVTANKEKNFTFILGASENDNYIPSYNTAAYNRVEVDFKDTAADIYYVANGKKNLLKSVASGVKYNSTNSFSYKFNKINSTDCVSIMLNGKTLLNSALPGKIHDYYFGIQSEVINIEVLDR